MCCNHYVLQFLWVDEWDHVVASGLEVMEKEPARDSGSWTEVSNSWLREGVALVNPFLPTEDSHWEMQKAAILEATEISDQLDMEVGDSLMKMCIADKETPTCNLWLA